MQSLLDSLLRSFKKNYTSKTLTNPTSKSGKSLHLTSSYNALWIQPIEYNLEVNKFLKHKVVEVDSQGRFHLKWTSTLQVGLFPWQGEDNNLLCSALPPEHLFQNLNTETSPLETDEEINKDETLDFIDEEGEGLGFSQTSQWQSVVEDWLPISAKLPTWANVEQLKLVWCLSGNELVLQSLLVNGLYCLDEFKQQGLLVSLNRRFVMLPYWLKQVYEILPNWNQHYNSVDSSCALTWLQEVQEWVQKHYPNVEWVLDDTRLQHRRILQLSQLELHAVASLRYDLKDTHADLIPFNDEIHQALGYASLTESSQAIQRALRNWQLEESQLIIPCDVTTTHKQVLIKLNEKQQDALLFLQREATQQPIQDIIDTLRFPPAESMLRHAPHLVDAFDIDINHYGERVIGIGIPPNLSGAYGKSKFTSVLQTDDLVLDKDPDAEIPFVSTSINEGTGAIYVRICVDDQEYVSCLPESIPDVLQNLQNARSQNSSCIQLKDVENNTIHTLTLPKTPEQLSRLEETLEYEARKAIQKRDNLPPDKTLNLKPKVLIPLSNNDDLEYQEEASTTSSLTTKNIPWEELTLKEGRALFPYQEECVEWLLGSFGKKPGVLLADDMGLGKTFQTLAFIRLVMRWAWSSFSSQTTGTNDFLWNTNAFKDESFCQHPILIVVPPILLDNFQKQADDFFENAEEFKFKVLQGDDIKNYRKPECRFNRGHELSKRMTEEASGTLDLLDLKKIQQFRCIMITYETLTNYQFSFAKLDWSLLICDEVQKAKNTRTNISNALKAVASKAFFKVMMSGTPVENDLSELWNIMDTAYPSKLGTLKDFRKTYQALFQPASQQQEESFKQLTQSLKFGDYQHGVANGRLKEDVYRDSDDFPRLYEHTEKIPMSEEDKETLKAYLRSDKPAILKVSLIKQYSLHPFLPERDFINKTPEAWLKGNQRLQHLFTILDDINAKQEKALVFCQYNLYQEVVQTLINSRYNGHPQLKAINSILSRKDKELSRFQNTEGFASLVLSPQCAGMGLNLQEANHVIHLSRWWNPAVEDQATCRAYRTGQTKAVHVYYFVADYFFENNLHTRLEEKRRLRQGLFDVNYLQDIKAIDLLSDSSDGDLPTLTQIDQITGESTTDQGRQFEEIVKRLLKKQGYISVERPRNGDKGLDWIATTPERQRYGVQVKHVSGGNPYTDFKALERFPQTLINHGLEQGLFITNGSISSNHRHTLKNNPVQWLDREKLYQALESFRRGE